MKYFKTAVLLLICIFPVAHATHPLSFYTLNNKKLHWQDEKRLNRFYMDFDGNGKVDRMDVLLDDGVDYYSQMHSKHGYQHKVRVRYQGKTITEEYQTKAGRKWKTYKNKTITKLGSSEIDYEVWQGEGDEKTGFKERLDSSSLLSEQAICRHPEKKEALNFVGVQAVLNAFPSIFDFDSSCLDFCKILVKKFKLPIENNNNSCQHLFESLAATTVDSTLSCLINDKKLQAVGSDIAQRILAGMRYPKENQKISLGNIKVKCVNNKKYLAKTFGLFPDEKKEITIDLGDFIPNTKLSLQEQFNIAFGHELYHIGGFFHTRNEIDVSYACNECCNTQDKLACHVCAQSGKTQIEEVDYLLAALMYDKFIGPDKEFRVYHKAIEKLHEVIQRDSFFENFDQKIPLSRGEIIEKFYFQLTTHLRNPVDDRGESKLRYSDMIAEIMAKLNCSDIGRIPSDQRTQQDRYGCEVMYLARSIPSSYCYQRKSKQSCASAIRLRYVRRKEVDRTGIPIPDNFLSLDQTYD